MLTSIARICLLQQDLFAFEILGGLLYLHADLGSGPVKIQASKARIDDGVWHDVALRRVERDGRVTVDSSTAEFRTPGKEFQRSFSTKSRVAYQRGISRRSTKRLRPYTANTT
jgi:hypothetical protein